MNKPKHGDYDDVDVMMLLMWIVVTDSNNASSVTRQPERHVEN